MLTDTTHVHTASPRRHRLPILLVAGLGACAVMYSFMILPTSAYGVSCGSIVDPDYAAFGADIAYRLSVGSRVYDGGPSAPAVYAALRDGYPSLSAACEDRRGRYLSAASIFGTAGGVLLIAALIPRRRPGT